MKKTAIGLISLCLWITQTASLAAHEDHEVKHSPLDFAIVHVDEISRSTPIRIRDFATNGAHLGKGKHRSQAEKMAEVAPGYLSRDLLDGLRANGFTDVSIVAGSEELPETCLVIDGNFSVLNPGSTTKRVLWGFGAGKTQVCIQGMILDGKGDSLAEFSHCRSGLGWGSAQPQMSSDAERMGNQIARFLAAWADGVYGR